MGRFFNIVGICRPAEHYMVEPENRLARLRPLIERKAWFVIHAPRQSGKTTTMRLLAEALTAEGRYAAVLASCKPGSTAGDDVERGIDAVVHSPRPFRPTQRRATDHRALFAPLDRARRSTDHRPPFVIGR